MLKPIKTFFENHESAKVCRQASRSLPPRGGGLGWGAGFDGAMVVDHEYRRVYRSPRWLAHENTPPTQALPRKGGRNKKLCRRTRFDGLSTSRFYAFQRGSWKLSTMVARMCLVAILTVLANGCQPATTPVPPVATVATKSTPAEPTSSLDPALLDILNKKTTIEETETIRFRDASETSGITFTHTSGNSPEKAFPTANGSGVAMIDYDGDGWIDLYFASTRELPLDAASRAMGNRLYRNQRDGTFEDVTERAGVGFKSFNHGVAVGDVDNNGHPDLYLTCLGGNVLYLNNGDGTFRDASAASGATCGLWCSGAAFLDYDRDGDLDLYVTCYGKWGPEEAKQFCGNAEKEVRTYCSPLTIVPERHFLFRNKGDATFEDVTKKAGVYREDGRGMGVVACDVNLDGWIDLYVANDMCAHFLFMNKGDGTFEDATESSGASSSESGFFQAGMGVDAEDLTGDGFPELFATHYREDYNTLYRNLDGRNFQDVSSWAGIVKDSMPDVGWACALADFDNDGRPDMFVVNGHVDDNLPLIGQDVPQAEPVKVWRSIDLGRFRLVNDPGPFFKLPRIARGAAFGDLDNDGDIDAVISLLDNRPAILLNESRAGSWVRLELMTEQAKRAAIGAMVEIRSGKQVLHRQLKGGGSYLSANDTRLLVGLGQAESIDEIVVKWPNGTRSTVKSPAVNQTHRLIEPRIDAKKVEGESR